MRIDGKSTRVRERIRLEIPLVVRYQETGAISWEETTLLRDVTPFGAGFFLKRPVEPKRLVHLTMPLPRQFRFYDHGLTDYRIWAVVRYVEANPPGAEQLTTFSIGVAFIGKETPGSYRLDPTTLYDLKPTLARGGAWMARSQPRRTGKFKRSEEERYERAFQVIIEAFDESGRVTACQRAETKDVSIHGAAVINANDLPIGRFVRLTNESFGISILAVVRGSRISQGGQRTLHLEFIDGQWPVETIE
jgi:hypothetical protein